MIIVIDNTTGTAEFDDFEDKDPDDCYCESAKNIPTKNVSILYKRWSVDNKEQYAKIAKFWDIVERYEKCDNLQGYGTEWSSDKGGDFLYGIIFKKGKVTKNVIDAVKKEFPDIKVSDTYPVPKRYDHTFEGKTKDIDPLYDKIWSKGPLAYELEEFTSNGTCKIHVIYKESAITESYIPLSEFDHFFQEAKMKAKTRKELDDSDFALVYKDASGNKVRKYPINDEAHVKAAARMFPRGVPNKYRKEVAGKILRRAHKFGIDTSGWKSLNAANEKD